VPDDVVAVGQVYVPAEVELALDVDAGVATAPLPAELPLQALNASATATTKASCFMTTFIPPSAWLNLGIAKRA
jgi:hypothetical protein